MEEWKKAVLGYWPQAEFTVNDGSGNTYGELGDVTAHVGPDMQADVVGVYTTDGFWMVVDREGGQLDSAGVRI